MPIRIQDGKLLYHVTAVENLENIFKHGLLSRTDAISKKLLKVNIADHEIIEKRKELGILQYVPFHFYEKTPFTWTIFNNNPEKSLLHNNPPRFRQAKKFQNLYRPSFVTKSHCRSVGL